MLNFLCQGIKGRYGVPRVPARGSAMFFYGLLSILCLTHASGSSSCYNPCPTGCTCTGYKDCIVNCSNAGLSGVPSQSDLPSSISHIIKIYLSYNSISSIGAYDLKFLTNLEEIHLQGNNINSIDPDAFSEPTLRIINLSNNPLKAVHGELFDGCEKAEVINLSQTQLTTLPDSTFDKIQCLKELDLSWNNIQFLRGEVFKSLKCLEVLDLSHNKFTTFPTNVLSLLTNLKKVNIAYNPFICNCDLMSFRTELVTLQSKGVELVDKNNVNCSNAPSVNLINQSSEKFWSCHPLLRRQRRALATLGGPDKLGSCYYDTEEKTKYDILFSTSDPVPDNQTCIETCFDYNSTFGIFEDGLCMCGYKHVSSSNACWCNLKTYVDGSNMACVITGTSTNIVYVSNVYPITAGITISPFQRVTAGTSQTFTTEVQLQTITLYYWFFGDSSDIIPGSSTMQSHTTAHTYAIPGTYKLSVTACTQHAACASITVPVEVRPALSSDSLEITCPTVPPALSSTINVTGKISAGYNAEYKWTKLPSDNVTATTEGQCEATWDFFRGRCLQKLPSAYTYDGATSTCNGGLLLTIHYPEEITEILVTYTGLSTIYLGAKKNGTVYKWTNGNQAYFMVNDVTGAANGQCVVIDRASGALKGVDCAGAYSIVCQQKPNTECPYGGHYYSTNNYCYKLYESNVNWTVADSNCNSLTNQSMLAVIDSLALSTFVITNVFGSVKSPAWVGLTDRGAESYLMWTNNQSVVNYNPVGTAPETDCFTVDSSGSWLRFSCKEVKYYICQYSLRESLKIPTYLAGFGRLASLTTLYNLSTLPSATAPANTPSVVNLFPGLWISHSGVIQKFNFRTVKTTSTVSVAFQVFKPVCAAGTTLINPGCDGNGSRYATCSSTTSTCTAAPYCNEGQESCYHTRSCIPVSDPCNCNNITQSYCNVGFIGTQPTYRLTGQIVVSLPVNQPAGYYSVNANGVIVNKGDILGFQIIGSGADVIFCDSSEISLLQNALQKFLTAASNVGDELSLSNWRNNTACYFQAVYTIPATVSLPPSLQYSTVAGTYTYELSLPDYNVSKSCTITVEEDVGDLVWIYPTIKTSSNGTDIFYVGADVKTYLVLAVKRGTNLKVEWQINNSTYTVLLNSSCPSSVQSVVGSLCDVNSYRLSQPFAYIEYAFTYNSGNTIPVQVVVKNTIDSSSKVLSAKAFLPLSVGFNLTSFTYGYLVEINKAVSFSTTVLSGNATTYEYLKNGSSVLMSNVGTFSHTFTAKNLYEMMVKISDGFSFANTSVTVWSRYKADVQNLTLSGIPSTVVINTSVEFVVNASVNADAFITVLWEFETGSVSETMTTSSTLLKLSKYHTHSINGTYTFRLTITDDFGNVKSITQQIRVVEAIPSVSLSATPTTIKTGSSIDFIATVPQVETKDYGALLYKFDFNDSAIESSSSKEKIHTYSKAGTYSVTVVVSNGAVSVQDSKVVKVLDEITGLSITCNRIVVVNSSISIVASVTTGTSVWYLFEIASFGLSSGNTTSSTYKVTLHQTGHFNITLTAWNDIGSTKVINDIYVVETTTLDILGFIYDRYKATNTDLNVVVDVLYYSIADLTLTWNFGGTIKKASGNLTATHTYTTVGVYTFYVTIQSRLVPNPQVVGNSTVEIQDLVSGLTVTNNGPSPLHSSSSATVTITASVKGGTNLRYTWEYGGKTVTTTSKSINITQSSEKEENVTVKVWNDVSSVNGTTLYKIQQAIEGLQITCLNCTQNNGSYYLQSTKTASFVAYLTYGTNVTYNWDFGDGGKGTGISQTHAYSTVNTYTVTLSAVNDVGTVPATFTIIVQEAISSVSLSVTSNPISVNSSFILTATPVGGNGIYYAWQDCGTCDQHHSTSTSYKTGIYNASGEYIVSVKAYNVINFVTASKKVTVLDNITSIIVTTDLIQGRFAAKDKSYNFAAQTNTDLGVMYNWSVKESSRVIYTLSSHATKNFSYSFSDLVEYEVVVQAYNILGSSYYTSITVDVQQPISGLSLTMTKASPMATGELVTVSAYVSTGTNLTYQWILQNSSGQYILPDTTKSIDHTFTDKGDYTFIVTVQNALGSATVNKSISVMEAVTGIGISSVVNESYPYIAVNTPVDFSAVVGAGENYTITWTLTDGRSLTYTFSGSNLIYNFSTSGTFKITVSVYNLVSSGQYELTVHVQGPITSLNLVPDVYLAKTRQLVKFTANYNSEADNLIFEWLIEGTVTNVTTNVLSHVFTTAGTFRAVIKVYNHISVMSTYTDIVVEVPISGFSITGCNLTEVINNLVSVTFSSTQGTNITYTYLLETESSTSISSTGPSVLYTFKTTGIYNLYVNASNQVSSVSSQCVYTIIGPVSGITVDTSKSDFFVNYTVQFQVTGVNLIGVSYDWMFLPTNENVLISNSLLQRTFTRAGTYTYNLTVFNSVSSSWITGTFVIEALHCDIMTVTRGGQSEKIRTKPSTSTFEVTVDKNGCKAYTLIYNWIVFDSPVGCSGTLNNSVSLKSSVVVNTPKLYLDQTLAVGVYCVQLITRYQNTPLVQVVGYKLTIIESDLVAIISGGSRMKYPSSEDINVDGSSSFDPDQSLTTLQYSWACSVSYPLVTPTGYVDACTMIRTSTSSSVTLTTTNILPGQIYTITLTVLAAGRTSGKYTQEIEISSIEVPVVIIGCVTCASKNNYIISAGDHVALSGSCLNCLSTDATYYEWSVFYVDSGVRKQLSLTSEMTTTGINNPNFVITSGNLPSATSYIFKLEISRTDLTHTTLPSATEMELKANIKAIGGTCVLLTNTAIDPLVDMVDVRCTGYTDPDNVNAELNYKVMSYSLDPSSITESVVIYYGTLASPRFYLAPWPGTTRTAVNIKVYVVDEDGADTLSLDQNVAISSTVSNGNQLPFIQSITTTTLAELVNDNNPTRLLQFGIALIHEINEISRQESLIFPTNSHVDDRNTIRNMITLSLLGLPLETTYQQQQMAFILNHLTKYPGEYQTSICQTLILNEVDVLKKDMESKAVEGADKSEFTSSLLLEAVSNSMDAVNAAVYSSVNISNVTTLDNTVLLTYKPDISSLDMSATVSSAEDHKKDIILRSFSFGDDIVILNLKTQVANEAPVIISLDSINVYGKRTWTDDIEQVYYSDNCVALLHPNLLTYLYPVRTEIFQIMMVMPKNPFTWGGSGDVELNTKVLAAGFTDLSGKDINVSNVPSGKKPKFIIMKKDGKPYNLTNSVVNSTSYSPQEGITFSSAIVKKSSVKKIQIDTSDGYGGSAMHLQIRFEVNPNPTAKENATNVIKAFLGKNYLASKSSYETMKEIKYEYMADHVDHRFYTLFVDFSNFDTDASYSVTVYNDDPYYDVNISAGVYFSTCQYFDMSANVWDTNGCAPTDESIKNYAVCECEHLTPFSGGMLAPPNTLSFTDLLNLDLSTNPVVFVACSLIFVVYVVGVIICRRLDQSNLERISSIPLCGKDGSFKYEVTVITGRQPGAGTTANVGIRLYGEYGKTSSKKLDKKWAFQRNCQDTFIMAHDVNLGNIDKIMIWHDNSGLDPSWYLVQVIVKDLQTDQKYYFYADFWMSLEMEKGFIQKELFAAGSSEIQKFRRMFCRAVSNCMADRHLWYSIVDRPAQSRFTRVQRATCVVTILYTFMAVNAIWYGLLKQADSKTGLSSFGWEEVVLSLVTNVMAFPITLLIIWMFKRSKSKKNIFEQGNRLGTAQTIEIDYDPNLAGSNDDLRSYFDRESTADSLVQATITQQCHLKRSRTLKMTRQLTDDSLNKAVNSFDSGIGSLGASTEGKLKRTNNPHMWSKGDVTHKDETYITKSDKNSDNKERKEEVKEVADGILQYLDDIESECMIKEQAAIQKRSIMGGGRLRRTDTKKSEWKDDVDEILHSDSESKAKSRPLRKKESTSTIGSYGKPASSQSGKSYNPREDPTIGDRKPTSAGSTFIWANKLRSSTSMDSTTLHTTSMPAVEGVGPLEPDLGLAQQSNGELDREEMELLDRKEGSKSCTLPAWFVYVAYVICFLLCVTSVVLVMMYGQKFGADIALQWILALLFCIAMSFIVIEPLKAVVIAFYASSVLKKEDTIDDDAIDIQPVVDTSNEKVKESKCSPLAGFALLNAREEGQKILRMRIMLRQFVAYIFYIWLLMTLCYINFSYNTYLFKSSVDNMLLQQNIPNTHKSFMNISDVDEFWSWSKSVLVKGLHHRELYTDLEYGTLLGVGRLRLVRSVKEPCPADEHPMHSGLNSLTNRSCWGNYGYNEDTSNYGKGWNLSQNLSWRYYTGSETGSKMRYGYVYNYDGGGYVQNLGTTYNDTLSILQDLQAQNWIDERTRAIFIDFTMYSAANDLTTVVNLMIEFPLTGGLNTSSDIQSQVLLRFVSDAVDPLMVCQCILFLVNIYLVCHIIGSIKDHKKVFFKDPWNWFEMISTLMAIVVNGLYIGCVVEATSTFHAFFNNKYGFTNYEAISDTHVAARYVQGILIFMLMIKVVKQLRFIKFLYVYERTLSEASGKLLGIAVIFLILFFTYGMAGHLWYGREVDGFETYWTTLTSIVGMQHGRFSFWPLMDRQPIFTHFFLYFYYAFCYGITIALILSVLRDSYRVTKSQMYFKATLDMQDYEMVEFIMKRFRLWAGLDKPKQGNRRVHFDRRQFSASSRSSRPSSRDSNLSYDPFETNPRTTQQAADLLEATWEDCLCTLERVCGLDETEDDMIKKTQKGIDEWKFQTRIKNYEKELQSCTDKPPKGAPTNSVRNSKIPRRTSTTGSEAGNSKRSLGTPDSRNTVMRGRPLSDQGGRAQPQTKNTNSRERFSIYNFFKSVNPSKDAWN